MDAFSLPRFGVVNNRSGPPGAGCDAFPVVIHPGPIDPVEALRLRTERAESLHPRRVFMIADNQDRAVLTLECRHAVMPGWNQQAVIHFFAVPGDYLVGKILRQIENAIRIRP